MTPDMTNAGDIQFALGEMRGEMRGMADTVNATSRKIDDLVREVGEIRGISVSVAAMEVRLTAAELQLRTLEAEKYRSEGAMGVGNWIVKHGANVGAMLIATGIIIFLLLKATGRIS